MKITKTASKFIFIFILLLSMPALSDSINYRNDIKTMHFNDLFSRMIDRPLRIDYDETTKQFDFYIKEAIYLTGFTITREEADKIISLIEKYEEWNTKAKEMSVTIDKEIGKFKPKNTFWSINSGDWSIGKEAEITISFFSQNKDRHQIVFSFPRLESIKNKHIKHKPEESYFDYDEAIKLKESLSDTAVTEFIVKAKEKAAIEAQFK